MDAFYIVDEGVDVKKHLREKLSGLVKHLFGNKEDYQFLEDAESFKINAPTFPWKGRISINMFGSRFTSIKEYYRFP